MLRALGDYGSLMLFPDKLFMERQVFAAPGLANPEDESVYLALGGGGRADARGVRRRGVLAGTGPQPAAASARAGSCSGSCRSPTSSPSTPAWPNTGSTCRASGFLLFLAGVALDLPISPAAAARRFAVAPRLVLLAVGALARADVVAAPSTGATS